MKTLLFILSLLSPFVARAETSVTEVLSADRNWGLSFFSLASMETEAAQRGGARTTAYNYVSATFRIDDNSAFAVRAPFLYQTAGFDNFNEDENQSEATRLTDQLVDYTINSYLLPGEIEVYSRVRFEIPLSESSIDQRKIGAFKFDFIFSRYLAPGWELEYWPTYVYNINSQTTYQNKDTGGISHTKSYELDHRLTAWYRVNEKLSFGFFVGGEDTWFNRSKTNDTKRQRDGRLGEHNLKLGPSMRYAWSNKVNFILNVADNVPLWGYTDDRKGETSDLGNFRPEHTEFVLLTSVNF
jgi:hypothetical protein